MQIFEWQPALDILMAESETEGFRFLRRAREEWLSGANTFAKEGEGLFGIFGGSNLLAIGGINRDEEGSGRLRRMYVKRDRRRTGIGKQLVEHLLSVGSEYYFRVGLRCDTESADRFYCSLGFRRVASDGDLTHIIDLPNVAP